MKFFATFAVLALSAVATASPVDSAAISKRAGPSGKVIKPSGGTSVDQGAGIQLEYTRVAGDSGYYTEYIDVDLVDQGDGSTTRVASGLTSADKGTNIQGYFKIPDVSNPESPPGSFRMQITEYQIGSDSKLISFQSAAPQFTVVPLGGSSCAGAAPGNCRNTQ